MICCGFASSWASESLLIRWNAHMNSYCCGMILKYIMFDWIGSTLRVISNWIAYNCQSTAAILRRRQLNRFWFHSKRAINSILQSIQSLSKPNLRHLSFQSNKCSVTILRLSPHGVMATRSTFPMVAIPVLNAFNVALADRNSIQRAASGGSGRI